MEQTLPPSLVELSADIAAAYLASNSLPLAEVPALIGDIYEGLRRLGNGATETPAGKLSPAVPVKKSTRPTSSSAWRTGSNTSRSSATFGPSTA